jgi:hypothetical protein
MATSADYRKWAEECFEWARAATDDIVREQYASLGRVWLERAARAELPSGTKDHNQPAITLIRTDSPHVEQEHDR